MPTGLYFASAKFSQDSYTPKKLMISAVADFLSYTEKNKMGEHSGDSACIQAFYLQTK